MKRKGRNRRAETSIAKNQQEVNHKRNETNLIKRQCKIIILTNSTTGDIETCDFNRELIFDYGPEINILRSRITL